MQYHTCDIVEREKKYVTAVAETFCHLTIAEMYLFRVCFNKQV